MVQILVPDTDRTPGSWTSSPLWSKVDDDSTVNPSGDGTTIVSADNTSGDTAELDLAAGTDPGVSTGHVLRVRWNKSASGGHTIDGVLQLWEADPGGDVQRAGLTVTGIGATEVESTYTLSGAEADSISDYSVLYVRLIRQGDTGGNPNGRRSLVVDLVELEIPDAAAAVPSITGTATTDVAASGTLSVPTASVPTLSGTATTDVAASGTLSVPAATVASISGTATTDVAASGTLSVPAATVPAVTGTATTDVGASGTLSVPTATVPTITGTATTDVAASGTLSVPSGGVPTISGTATTDVAASGTLSVPTATVPALSGTATTDVAASGTLSVPTATVPALSGTATTDVAASGVLSVPAATVAAITGTATTDIAASGTLSVPAVSVPAITGTAVTDVAASGILSVPTATVPTIAGTATTDIAASGVLVAPVTVLVHVPELTGVVVAGKRTATVSNKSRTGVVVAGNRTGTIMVKKLRQKDPDAIIRYRWDFNPLIDDGVTVSTQQEVGTTGGITVGALSETDGVVSGLVSGGTVWSDATATVRVTLSDGQQEDLTVTIPIREQ